MTYAQQLLAARIVAVIIVLVTLIQAGNADLLGITPRIAAWLAIFVGVLGTVAGWLPAVKGGGRDPETLASRVKELAVEDRRKLLDLLDPPPHG